jgi:hypothetical protein
MKAKAVQFVPAATRGSLRAWTDDDGVVLR